MGSKITLFSISNKKGFTLIELLMVVAILGVLTTIAIKRITEERQKASDAQAISFMRNLLTKVETDPPSTANPYNPGDVLDDYPDVQLTTGLYLNITNDAEDRWQFWLAHRGGARHVRLHVVHRSSDGAARLDRDPAQHRHDRPR